MKFKVKLRLTDSGGKKAKYSLNLEENAKFMMGRGSPGIGQDLAHPTVSGTHCYLIITDGNLYVHDAASRNGIRVNGRKVESARVKVGDFLQIGEPYTIEFLEAPSRKEETEENPAATRFIDVGELSTEEQAAVGKGPAQETMIYTRSGNGSIVPQMPTTAAAPAPTPAELGAPTETPALDGDTAPALEEPTGSTLEKFPAVPTQTDVMAAASTEALIETPMLDAEHSGSPRTATSEIALDPYASPRVRGLADLTQAAISTNAGAAPIAEAPTNPNAAYAPPPPADYQPAQEPDPMVSSVPAPSPVTPIPELPVRNSQPAPIPERPAFANEHGPEETYVAYQGPERRNGTNPVFRGQERRAPEKVQGKAPFDQHVLVSFLIATAASAAASAVSTIQHGALSVPSAAIGGVAGGILCAGLAWLLNHYNEFMEAEASFGEYFRFLSFAMIGAIPLAFLTNASALWKLAAFIGGAVVFFHLFMAKYRPLAERLLLLVGGYLAALALGSYFITNQISPANDPARASIARHARPEDAHPNDDAGDEEENDSGNVAQNASASPTSDNSPVQATASDPNRTPSGTNTDASATNRVPPENQHIDHPNSASNQPTQATQTANQAGGLPGADSFAISQLYTAAEKGDVSIVRTLVLNKHVNPNSVSETGVTALMLAAYYGHVEVARFLLDENAEINTRDRSGTTALMWAVLKQHRDMVALLAQRGADLNAKRNDGDTALDIARLWHYDDIAQILRDPASYRPDRSLASPPTTSRVVPPANQRRGHRVRTGRGPSSSSKSSHSRSRARGKKYSATEDDEGDDADDGYNSRARAVHRIHPSSDE